MLMQLIFVAVAINLDSFVAGLAYGIAATKLPPSTRLVIAVAAGCALALSISAGDFLRDFLPAVVAEGLSIALLLGFAVFLIWRNSKESNKQKNQEKSIDFTSEKLPEGNSVGEEMLWQFNLAFLGVIIKVLKRPNSCCDPNSEAGSNISFGEALLLGIALSLDSLGAGLAIGVLGFPIGLTVIMTIVINYILLTVAVKIGGSLNGISASISKASAKFASYIPAFVLLLLGIWKLAECFFC